MTSTNLLYLTAVAIGTGLIWHPASAYEISTHALISERACQVSVLGQTGEYSISSILGFDRLDTNQPFAFQGVPHTTDYYDDYPISNWNSDLPGTSDIPSFLRTPQNQERNVFNDLAPILSGHPADTGGTAIEQQLCSWLMRGAIREDDNDAKLLFWFKTGDRDDDPYGRMLRAAKHFYDPFHDRAFDFAGYCSDYDCEKSVDWALGSTDHSRRNHFTWENARNNYWWALTLKRSLFTGGQDSADTPANSHERLDRWATAIKSLGHVIHLVQDAAQPQHARNDAHAPPLLATPGEEADAAYEAFTDYRVLRNADAVGIIWGGGNPLRRMTDDNLPPVSMLAPIRMGENNPYPGNGARVQFNTAARFFTTRNTETGCGEAALLARRGMADFSNRSFFTTGTLPGFREAPGHASSDCDQGTEPTYPLPPGDLENADYVREVIPNGLRINDKLVHVAVHTYPITDVVAPSYDANDRVPVLTEGIWTEIIPGDLRTDFLRTTGYLVSYQNMTEMADVLLPRAVGYSAGMIDYFFRGRLELSSPPDGLFGVVDQGTPHTVDSAGYPRRMDDGRVLGFEMLRVRVKNATADITESGTSTVDPQDIGVGRLVAIARYHRNPCYQPDLSGEFVKLPDLSETVPAGCALADTRTDYQEISVSKPLTITTDGQFLGVNSGLNPCANVGSLNTGATGACAHPDGVLAEFDFSEDPIPISATDLFIQLAFRGELGDETDGIAVGIMDLLEPNFYTVLNSTDWFLYYGEWKDPAEVDGQVPGGTAPIPISVVYMCWGDQAIFGFAQPDPVGPGQFSRFATIADKEPHTTTTLVNFGGSFFPFGYYPFVGHARQSDREVGGNWAPTSLEYGRGTTWGTHWDNFYQDYPHGMYPAPVDGNGVSLTRTLTPTLGTVLGPGPGLPVPGIALYTSMPDTYCIQYQQPGAHLPRHELDGHRSERGGL